MIPIMILVIFSEQYRIERIIGFLKPSEGGSSFNYQTNAAKNAITAGGIWGTGIGRGISRLNSIPEVNSTDNQVSNNNNFNNNNNHRKNISKSFKCNISITKRLIQFL